MNNLQKMGGLSALMEALIYLAGMVFFLLVMDYTALADPMEKVTLLVNNQSMLYFMNLLIYVIFGVFLIILALALHDRLKAASPALMQVGTALALIWAGLVIASGMVANIGTAVAVNLYSTDPGQASTVWLAIEAVADGIGGGNEIVGGLWTLLVSWSALRSGEFSRVLNYLGLIVGAAGVASAIPAFGEIGGMIFGLGQLVWFAWLGVTMLRSSAPAAAGNPDASVPQFRTSS
jgi:hypothetical protein